MNWSRTLYPLVVASLRQTTPSAPRLLARLPLADAVASTTNASLASGLFRRTFVPGLQKSTAPNTTTTTVIQQPSRDGEIIPPLLKKRAAKPNNRPPGSRAGFYNVVAYATAEEYDLERLQISLRRENLYELHDLPPADTEQPAESASAATSPTDYLYVARRGVDSDSASAAAAASEAAEPREIFFFRSGSVVLWNCSELECHNVLAQLKHCELEPYDRRLVEGERDCMSYAYEARARMAGGNFVVTRGTAEAALEKYTFANALSTSVKLGIWEAALDRYVESMAFVTADLKRGAKIRMTRAEALRKTGELFALRHSINLSSDLLDTPDFYWDREQLEGLYSTACGYFSVQRRTKVMNERLNHCIELADLVASNLNDIHHVRLEWMIIILIMVEVAFEMIHLLDRFL